MNIFWFRRDLRINDNAGLYHALRSGKNVQPIFVFDEQILNKLTDKTDKRVQFIHQTLLEIKSELNEMGADLWVFYGNPLEVFKNLVVKHTIQSVFANRDYEPSAIKRDDAITAYLASQSIDFKSYKDQVVFDTNEVL